MKSVGITLASDSKNTAQEVSVDQNHKVLDISAPIVISQIDLTKIVEIQVSVNFFMLKFIPS